MNLRTERLLFRPVSISDLEDVDALHSLPETDKYNTLGIPENIGVTEAVIKDWLSKQTGSPQTSYVFCLELKETGDFIGLIALNLGKANYKSAEVWYKVHSSFWNKGYTTEALKELLRFSFKDLDLHRVQAGCAVENIASIKVLEKVGMTREGKKRKILPIRGEWFDNYFYAILEEDYADLHK